jgi:putative membrane protein
MLGSKRPRRWLGMPVMLLAVGAMGLGACGEPMPEVTVVQPAPPGMIGETVVLSAGNLAALVEAANTATVQRAEVARQRASDPRVRDIANRIYNEGLAARGILAQQLVTFGITPQPEATAVLVSRYANQTVSMMQSARGLGVDRIYLESEIANHRWVIGVLDSVIPTLGNSTAEGRLNDIRNGLAQRLFELERLQVTVL